MLPLSGLGMVGVNGYFLNQIRTYTPVTLEAPYTVADLALYSFDRTVDGYLHRMRLGTLLADPPCPVLILHGEARRQLGLLA